MKKRYTFVANWKMYLDFNESINYSTSNLDSIIALSELPNSSIVLCPSFPALYPIAKIFDQTKVKVGAQNCSDHTKGAFTGQICVKTLNQIGCHACIIGHSEIRRHKNETDEVIAKKFDLLLDAGLSPVLCIGESEQESIAGATLSVLEQQLKGPLEIVKSEIKKLNGRPIYIAYEPEWSIGSGKIAESDKLEAIFAWISSLTQKSSPTSNWQFLYGGSVDALNVKKLRQIGLINGFLIGKAGTNFEEFEKIVKYTILGNDS